MIPYLAAFALPLAAFPLRRLSRTGYVFLLAAVWSVFAGLRLDIGGGDYYAYQIFFEGIWNPEVIARYPAFEPLFRVLTAACSAAGTGFHGFLAVTALIGILPALHVIDKYSGDSPAGFIVYGTEWMYYLSFVILRQGLAMGLTFLVLDAVQERRYIRAGLLAAAAAGFHYSALVLWVLPFFQKELKPRTRVLLFLAAGAAFLGMEAGTLVRAFDQARLGRIGARLLIYFLRGAREPINLLNAAEIVAWTFLIRRYADRESPLIRNAYFLYLITVVAGLQHAILLRFGWYFELSFTLLAPAITDPGKDRPKERTWIGCLLVAYQLAKAARWLLINAGGTGGFLPYRTIL